MLMSGFFGNDPWDSFFNDFPLYGGGNKRRIQGRPYTHQRKSLMRTDVKETAGSYVLEMELPGFKKDEIEISLEDGYLTIHAAKKADKETEEKENYICRERFSGACERKFHVGEDILDTEIGAAFDQGILTLTLPKKDTEAAVEKRKYIAIDG